MDQSCRPTSHATVHSTSFPQLPVSWIIIILKFSYFCCSWDKKKVWCITADALKRRNRRKRQSLFHSPSETMLYKKLQHVWAAVFPSWLNAVEVTAEKHAALFTCMHTHCLLISDWNADRITKHLFFLHRQTLCLNKSVKTQTQSLPHRRAHFLSLKETNIILFLHAHAHTQKKKKSHSQCQTIPTFLSDKAPLHPQKKACLSESDAQWDIHILVSPVKYSTHLDTRIQTK